MSEAIKDVPPVIWIRSPIILPHVIKIAKWEKTLPNPPVIASTVARVLLQGFLLKPIKDKAKKRVQPESGYKKQNAEKAEKEYQHRMHILKLAPEF